MLENQSHESKNIQDDIELEEKNRKNLYNLIALRSAFFKQDDNKLEKKDEDKKNFLTEFLEPYLEKFNKLKSSWEKSSISANSEALAISLAGKLDGIIEKYLPSSPQEKERFEQIKHRLIGIDDPKKIKLKSDENLIDQLVQNNVDLEYINIKIKATAIINPFSTGSQSVPIKLRDGRELLLDVKKYAEDLAEYNQLKQNTKMNALPGFNSDENKSKESFDDLDLYGKYKFNQKFPQEDVKIKLSEREEKTIESLLNQAKIADQKREEALKKFAEKFGLNSIAEDKSWVTKVNKSSSVELTR